MGFNVNRSPLETIAGNCVAFPFSFVINGTTTPDGLSGTLETVTRSSAGKFVGTIEKDYGVPYKCVYADVSLSTVADSVDILPKIDWSSVAVNGTFTVRTFTGAVQTDPADNTVVGGILFLELDDRGP